MIKTRRSVAVHLFKEGIVRRVTSVWMTENDDSLSVVKRACRSGYLLKQLAAGIGKGDKNDAQLQNVNDKSFNPTLQKDLLIFYDC